MTLSKLSSLFDNSLLLSPTPSVSALCLLNSLIFCFSFLLTLKGLNKGFSIRIFDGDSSGVFCLGIAFVLMDSPKTCRYLLV